MALRGGQGRPQPSSEAGGSVCKVSADNRGRKYRDRLDCTVVNVGGGGVGGGCAVSLQPHAGASRPSGTRKPVQTAMASKGSRLGCCSSHDFRFGPAKPSSARELSLGRGSADSLGLLPVISIRLQIHCTPWKRKCASYANTASGQVPLSRWLL